MGDDLTIGLCSLEILLRQGPRLQAGFSSGLEELADRDVEVVGGIGEREVLSAVDRRFVAYVVVSPLPCVPDGEDRYAGYPRVRDRTEMVQEHVAVPLDEVPHAHLITPIDCSIVRMRTTVTTTAI